MAWFLCWRDIYQETFFLEKTLNFFSYRIEETGTVNQVINEIVRQMTITLTLALDIPVRPMDAKGLSVIGVHPPLIILCLCDDSLP